LGADLEAMRAVLAGIQAAAEDRARDPVAAMRWLPLQRAFLADTHWAKLIRAGNQTIGKTTLALAEVIGRCRGRHPLGVAVPPPPIQAYIICATWQQSLGIQEKLAALLPWGELDPRTSYTVEQGFAPVKSPAVKFRNGSLIRIKTTNQDAISFAGASIDVVLFDEPPSSTRLLVEAAKRLEDRGGVLLMSLTPINAPDETIEHLRSLCEAGTIHDHWRPLTEAELVPIGASRPVTTAAGVPKDAAWIAKLGDLCDDWERPIVVDGAWRGGTTDRYFSRWCSANITPALPDAPEFTVAIGVDHGDRPGKQIALLLYVDERDSEAPVVHVIDEYVDATGVAQPRHDAEGILSMLERHGLRWSDVDLAHGDRVHMPGTGGQKSNKDLAAHIAKELFRTGQIGNGAPVQIETVKRGEGRAGSLRIGARYVYHLVSSGRLTVHPRCRRLIDSMERWDMRDSDYKDPVDALRYALDPWIFGERSRRRSSSSVVRFG
jgi:hypothetical protein